MTELALSVDVPLLPDGLDEIEVDWRRVGALWERRLITALRTSGHRVGGGGWRPVKGTDRREYIYYRGDTLGSWLQAIPIEGGNVKVRVRGAVRPPQWEMETWRSAVLNATAVVASAQEREYRWKAVLGCPEDLDALMPSGLQLDEFDFEQETRIVSGSNKTAETLYRPLNLIGRTVGFDWDIARLEARRQARRVAALLTVAAGVLVDVQWEPLDPATEGPGQMTERPIGGPVDRQIQIPDWLNVGWRLMGGESRADTAVLAHHEARRLRSREFTSTAFMMFVASIEGAGLRLKALDPACATCKFKRGAMRAFGSALETIESKESETFNLLKTVYSSYRSPTAHEGVLHGTELTGYGTSGSGNPFLASPESLFSSVELWRVMDASRRVLVEMLRSGASD